MVFMFAVIQDYCQGGTFEARCSQNEVILMTHAQYGRMREGNCVDAAYGNVGCYENILPLMDQKCSGLQACQVLVSDLINDKIDFACPKDLTSYLEAAYACIEGEDCIDIIASFLSSATSRRATVARREVLLEKNSYSITARSGDNKRHCSLISN